MKKWNLFRLVVFVYLFISVVSDYLKQRSQQDGLNISIEEGL